MPRHPDPDLEQRILSAASRLWARGGEKSLTMRAVAKAAGTTTPTVYERYQDRSDILRALRLKTRSELFAALSRTRSLGEAIENYLRFALDNTHSYEVLFDGVGRPPSLYEPWPSFNLMRERLAERLSGSPRQHNRLMLAIWSLMHGTAMLIIRGGFEGILRTQAIHACVDAVESLLVLAARPKTMACSGPKWPPNLILGEAEQSRVGNGGHTGRKSKAKRRTK
ncbi:MAG TPA: TetR/AcrR family transcriptional regulator [Candidatus Dormibacteraeota bacterium]|nr:TetR/AcrR family transcriptional regulator [Candidatus Dormibacteraeota bacterium]